MEKVELCGFSESYSKKKMEIRDYSGIMLKKIEF